MAGRCARAMSSRLAVLLLAVALAGCAGSVAAPTRIGPANPGFDAAHVSIGAVSVEARPGVTMTAEELARVGKRIETALAADFPTRVAAGGTNVRVVFTEYDHGNAFARAMMAGLGQIHIAGTVTLIEPTSGDTLSGYEVDKTFAFGGIYGASVKIEDVEEGFAKSVAAIFGTAAVADTPPASGPAGQSPEPATRSSATQLGAPPPADSPYAQRMRDAYR